MMLIVDIISYVRQLLPPSYRDPKTIGIISALLRPIGYLIERYNQYRYLAKFDTGEPGQLFALQYLLRETVHPSIRIVDGNFNNVDFRVLVPSALTNEESALLVSLIERYRLHGRRYDVSVNASWGAGGAIGGLQWIDGYPRLNQTENGWVITYGIKQTGMYLFRLRNDTTGSTLANWQTAFVGGSVFQRVITEPGIYSVRVGGLSATLIADNTGTICDLAYASPPFAEMHDTYVSLRIHLYSGRANIGPFNTRMYNNDNGLIQEFQHTISDGHINVPRFGDGTYKVETLDKFGCQTTRETVHIGDALAWNLGFPNITEDDRISYSINQSGEFETLIELVGGEDPLVDITQVYEALSAYNTDPLTETGVYRIQVGELETFLTFGGGISCDLTWQDEAIPGSAASLSFRIESGQQQLKASLYSGRAGISPFFLEVLQGDTVVFTTSYSSNDSWQNVGPLTAGSYFARVTDKDGCRTSSRAFTATVESGGGPSPLVIPNVGVSKSGTQYVVTVLFSGGSGSKIVQVVGSGGLIMSVTGVTISPRTITLPTSTAPQTVKVVVSDSTGSVEYAGVVLPSETDGAYTPVLWSEGFRKYIHLQVSGSPGNWRVSDVATYNPPSGYHRYYWFGNKLIRQDARLTNEPWQSNNPLNVAVFFMRTDAPDTNYWAHALRWPGGWGDPYAGISLDKSDIGAYESYIFQKS